MQEKLKLAIIIRAFNRGGAEVLIREMFANENFNKAVGDCDLIILDGKRIELLKDLKKVNAHIFNIFSSSYIGFFKEYYKLHKFIKERKYTIIHSHLPNAAILLRFLKFLHPKVKLVYSEHNIVDSYIKVSFFLNGITYSKDDHTIFVSQEVKSSVDKHKRRGFYNYKNGSVVINGIDPKKFINATKANVYIENFLIIGTVVSFRKWKRLDRWIEVVEAFKRNYANIPVKFIIAGSGPEKKAVEELIAQKELNDYVQLPGLVIDTVSVYNNLDIFLMTSEFEGLPVALLEAMSCACVPIVSNVGGIKNLDFENFGYKYENFDAAQLAAIIFQYYNDRSKIIEEGNKARTFILENHNLDKQVDEYINIYNNLHAQS